MHCHSKKFANFDFVEDTFARQFKKKRVSFWYCARLIVSLQAEISYKYIINNLIIITKKIL